MEELVAELGAAFLCADLAITGKVRDDHASYIESWLQVLKQDKRAIFTAASHASKAVEYLHKLQPTADSEADQSNVSDSTADQSTDASPSSLTRTSRSSEANCSFVAAPA